MRVLVEGRTVKNEWEDADDNERTTFKIEARRIGILPYRIQAVTLSARTPESEPAPPQKEAKGAKAPKDAKAKG